MTTKRKRLKVVSLFANIGVAEAYLKDIGVDVVVANEIDPRRAELYKKIYPDCNMICGNILNKEVFSDILSCCERAKVDVVLATPPCQGMSTAGQKKEFDERNNLVLSAINVVKAIHPRYVMIENVPEFKITSIMYKGKATLLTEVIKNELQDDYFIEMKVINTDDYMVPQTRERIIILMTQKDVHKKWAFPPKASSKVTMQDAIGNIPPIDPFVKDISENEFKQLFPNYEKKRSEALKISKWNEPPVHVLRQVKVMQYTPSGCSAFDNAPEHRPQKIDGSLVRGYHNTYKRQNWDTPAYTVTMDNRKISSQNNVHPGRKDGFDKNGVQIYSDARTLTLYEIMKIMSIPDNWNLPDDTNEAFLRRIIGEGIPPLFGKQVFEKII